MAGDANVTVCGLFFWCVLRLRSDKLVPVNVQALRSTSGDRRSCEKSERELT